MTPGQDKSRPWWGLKERAFLGKKQQDAHGRCFVLDAEKVSLCEHLLSLQGVSHLQSMETVSEGRAVLCPTCSVAIRAALRLTASPREQPQSQPNNLHFDESRCARREKKSENFGLIWMPLCLVGVEGEREDFPCLYKNDWFLSHPIVPSAERTGRWESIETTAGHDSGCRSMLLLPLLVKILFGHLNDIDT